MHPNTTNVELSNGVTENMAAVSSKSLAPSPSHRRSTMNFGKFYQTSYLDMNGNVIKKGSISSPNLQPRTFHRPDNFSYQKTAPKYGKSKRAGTMLDLLRGDAPRAVKVVERRSRSTDAAKSPERPADTEEIIKLSHYPSAEVRKDVPPAIEREDWPAPPAMAVITKNLVRTSLANKYDKNSSDEEEADATDGKIKKELDEIAKIDSAMVKCIKEDLTEQMKQDKKRLLDPRSASRTPSASKEPVQPPRYESPFNASPSRTLVERPRFLSESTPTTTHSNGKKPVVHGATTSHRYRVKPGYSFGYVSKSLSTVPPGTPGAYVYDSFNNISSDEDEEIGIRELERKINVVDLVIRNGDEDDDDRDSVFERGSSQRCSTMSDSVVFLKHLLAKKSSTSIGRISSFDGSPFINASSFDYRKRSESVLTLWEELLFEPEEPIPYSELCSASRRKGLSKTNLEKYLSNEEFEQYLGSTREEFYKLPEFRRNDIKQKAKLF